MECSEHTSRMAMILEAEPFHFLFSLYALKSPALSRPDLPAINRSNTRGRFFHRLFPLNPLPLPRPQLNADPISTTRIGIWARLSSAR